VGLVCEGDGGGLMVGSVGGWFWARGGDVDMLRHWR